MTRYVTRVSVWFYSEGASPSAVMQKLLELGFKAVRGAYDFVYAHGKDEMDDRDLSSAILEISNAIHATLKGFKVLYTLDTQRAEDVDHTLLQDIDEFLDSTRKEIRELEDDRK
ncbi:MAG: hypothetical protein KAT22_02395 [Candidatus Thorarchaeota archaeon]|jgi:DNA-binding transcriptional regulator GbsR (MarR family)|nr:hypothetical protein [Candidatus Thorarchaeota archaeon]